jgi:hypothetical protein
MAGSEGNERGLLIFKTIIRWILMDNKG